MVLDLLRGQLQEDLCRGQRLAGSVGEAIFGKLERASEEGERIVDLLRCRRIFRSVEQLL